jgi:putative transposase
VGTRHCRADLGQVDIDAPRDRNGSFAPKIVRKRQRRFEGFDDKILALYSSGLSTRDIEAHLAEIYGVKVGRELISKVTDGVMDDVRAWAQRPLEDVYPVIFLDALVLKIRENGTVQRRACYLALGITVDGDRDVLGMWFQETEGAKFWMQVLSELKHRGVSDILICCVDGLKGFPEAIEAIFPKTTVPNLRGASHSGNAAPTGCVVIRFPSGLSTRSISATVAPASVPSCSSVSSVCAK